MKAPSPRSGVGRNAPVFPMEDRASGAATDMHCGSSDDALTPLMPPEQGGKASSGESEGMRGGPVRKMVSFSLQSPISQMPYVPKGANSGERTAPTSNAGFFDPVSEAAAPSEWAASQKSPTLQNHSRGSDLLGGLGWPMGTARGKPTAIEGRSNSSQQMLMVGSTTAAAAAGIGAAAQHSSDTSTTTGTFPDDSGRPLVSVLSSSSLLSQSSSLAEGDETIDVLGGLAHEGYRGGGKMGRVGGKEAGASEPRVAPSWRKSVSVAVCEEPQARAYMLGAGNVWAGVNSSQQQVSIKGMPASIDLATLNQIVFGSILCACMNTAATLCR